MVASIEISPADATAPVLGTVQFLATAEDQFGNPIELDPQWSTSGDGGEIDANGLFTAGSGVGTFSGAIVVSAGGVTESASVSVEAGPVLDSLGEARDGRRLPSQ